jgi:hypothetical protein
MTARPKPFDSELWEGWTKREKHNAVARGEYGTPKYQWISVIGQLHVEDEDQSVCLWFPSPEHARQVAECILAAQRGEQAGPVAELVEALRALANCGYDDFGGTYVNLQVVIDDILDARALLKKYEATK